MEFHVNHMRNRKSSKWINITYLTNFTEYDAEKKINQECKYLNNIRRNKVIWRDIIKSAKPPNNVTPIKILHI